MEGKEERGKGEKEDAPASRNWALAGKDSQIFFRIREGTKWKKRKEERGG